MIDLVTGLQFGESAENNNGLTSLGFASHFAAAFEGNLEIAQLLIDNEADNSGESGQGSAVSIASKRGHNEFADLLRQKGAIE